MPCQSPGRNVDTLSWFAVALLFAAVGFLVLLTAAEAYTDAVPVSRRRLATPASRGLSSEILRHYVEERRFLLACLGWGRTATVAVITGLALYLSSQTADRAWWVHAVTVLGVIIAASFLQAFPRLLVSESPEAWARPVLVVGFIARGLFGLPVTLLEAPARAAARSRRTEDEASRATREAQELLHLVEMEEEAGVSEAEEREMIRGVIGMVDTQALEIMVPRTDVIAVSTDATFDEVTQTLIREGKSRIPLYDGTIDNIVGIIYAKDVLRHLASEGSPPPLTEIARPPYFIPETKRVDELLAELRRHRVHFAVVVDEYGGTAGVVTIEDLIEEIVGEIEDEYDVQEVTIERIAENEAVLDGRVPVEDVNELFGVEIEHEDFDTIGGLVLSELGRMPVTGDEVRVNGIRISVLDAANRRVRKVRAVHVIETAEAIPEEPAENR